MKRVNSESNTKQGLSIAESCASSTTVKTSVNTNNIESKNQEFFTKGTKYRCIKSVKGDFTKGKVYEQSSDPTQWYGYFRNDQGVHHVWPQPANIARECALWGYKPEDIDPRLYFEPVEA